MAKIAFLGLGVMGYHMAGHLAAAGHDVVVYNRTTSKAERWVKEFGGQLALMPGQACVCADYVMACVGNDDDVRQIISGEGGAFNFMKSGAIFVDHTTTSALLARELSALAKHQALHFIDAPVSGGEAGAKNATLTVMCGGEQSDYLRIYPLIAAYAKHCELIGASGSGQLAKMVNQICIAGLLQALSEAINFGINAGLDMPKVLDVISKGAAQSWQMENRGLTMLEDQFEFGFAVNLMRKDLNICFDEAQRNHSELTVTKLVDRYYAQIQQMHGGLWDTSSLLRLLRQTSR